MGGAVEGLDGCKGLYVALDGGLGVDGMLENGEIAQKEMVQTAHNSNSEMYFVNIIYGNFVLPCNFSLYSFFFHPH